MAHRNDREKNAAGNSGVRVNLSAIGAAAVLTVYSAGFARTKAAADRFAAEDTRRATASAGAADLGSATGSPDSIVTPIAASVLADSVVRPLLKDAAPKKKPPLVAKDADAIAAKPAAKATPESSEPSAPVTAPVQSAPIPQSIPIVVDEPAPDTAPTPRAAAKYKDGVYLGWGSSRHGDIQASVEIRNGLIVSATIAQCRTQYSCSRIDALPPQVVARQSAEVDYVSRATQSSNAFYYAVANALAQAK